MLSHELLRACSSPRAISAALGALDRAAHRGDELLRRRRATATTGVKLCTTSATAVETIGLPAAMYSSVFVGLMYSVASLSAKGIRQTSNPFTCAGSSA